LGAVNPSPSLGCERHRQYTVPLPLLGQLIPTLPGVPAPRRSTGRCRKRVTGRKQSRFLSCGGVFAALRGGLVAAITQDWLQVGGAVGTERGAPGRGRLDRCRYVRVRRLRR